MCVFWSLFTVSVTNIIVSEEMLMEETSCKFVSLVGLSRA